MKKLLLAAVAVAFMWIAAAPAYAAVSTEFTQNIGTGTLSVMILDETETTVDSPAVPLAGRPTHPPGPTSDRKQTRAVMGKPCPSQARPAQPDGD